MTFRPRFSIRGLLGFTLLVGATLGCCINLPALLGWAYHQWEIGLKFDQQIFEEPQFALRVTASRERGTIGGAPGGYYRYEVKTAAERRWRRITLFRLPSPEQIPTDHIHHISDACAYFSHGWVFGITSDGGRTWSIKGGIEHQPIFIGQGDPNGTIERVSIDADGNGMMQLANFDYKLWKPLPSIHLVTSDFGRTWSEQ